MWPVMSCYVQVTFESLKLFKDKHDQDITASQVTSMLYLDKIHCTYKDTT